MKERVLRLLRERGDFVSGQELCDLLGVSRTAVWKVIHQLEDEGYVLEAITRKGYRLVSSPEVVTAAEIGSRMRTQWAGRSIAFFKEIDSTNSWARKLGEEGAPEGTLVVADRQLSGRGRRGRGWFSPAGTGIWMTILLRPELSPDRVSAITLAAALSVCRAVREVTGLHTSIKWPNDLVVDGKKVCGILTEMSVEPDYIHYVVIGIGINVNQTDFPDDLPHAYSLAMAARHSISRAAIIARVWECFEEDYAAYLKYGNMRGLKERYEEHLANLNRPVRVLAPAGEWDGTAEGIDDSGDLLVRDRTGELHCVNSGEVSVRGVYGYT